jgi:hypothetical protein
VDLADQVYAAGVFDVLLTEDRQEPIEQSGIIERCMDDALLRHPPVSTHCNAHWVMS